MLGIHAKIIRLAILLLSVVIVELGIHLGKESVQVHAIAVKDIFIDFFLVIPALGDSDIVGVCFLPLGAASADDIGTAVIVDVIAIAVISLIQLIHTVA